MTKHCSRCNQDVNICLFEFNKSTQDRYNIWCSVCIDKVVHEITNVKYCNVDINLTNYRNRKIGMSEPIHIRIRQSLNSRIRIVLNKNNTKRTNKLIELLGCNISDLKIHIESLFKSNMSWSNYGKEGWNIDHIRPCASFDLTDLEQQKLCFHYTNLQPLWAKYNESKGSLYEGVRHKHIKSNQLN